MGSEDMVRGRVEKEIGELGDEGWEWLVGVYFQGEEPDWDTASPKTLAHELEVEFMTARRFVRGAGRAGAATGAASRARTEQSGASWNPRGARTEYPHPPAWWTEASREVAKSHRPVQTLVWSQLGIEGPYPLGEVEALLLEVRALETDTGEKRTFSYPAPESLPGLIIEREMEVRTGWTRTQLLRGDAEQHPLALHTQPLASLARHIASIASKTGCADAEVCAFLLSDEPLRLPWVEYDYAGIRAPSQIAPAIVLTVGTPEVPADDVRRAYLFARDFQRKMRSRAKKVGRRSRPTTWDLVAFVEERRPSIPWKEIFEAWHRDHPRGTKGFHKTMESMRAAYYRAPMRRKKVAR